MVSSPRRLSALFAVATALLLVLLFARAGVNADAFPMQNSHAQDTPLFKHHR